MKNLILLVILLCSIKGVSQSQLNEYKFVVIPKKFSCFKNQNEYKTSTLIKYLFTKEGFDTYYQDALAEDLQSNRCLGLYVDLNDESSMFRTKVSLVFKDCNTNEIYETVLGTSKEKYYAEAYNEAIKNAFVSIQALDYSYTPKTEKEAPLNVSFKNDVKKIEKEEVDLPKNKMDTKVVEQEATIEEQRYVNKEPVNSNIKKAERQVDKVDDVILSEPGTEVLYAQKIPNGFQLVDSTPKILMKILKTSKPDYFMAESSGENGVVFMQDGKWYFEHYVQDILKTEELFIKF